MSFLRSSASVQKPISERLSSKAPAGFLAVFFSFFLLFGLAFLYFFFIQAALRVLEARQWTEIPCVVLSSEVKRHSGSKGSSTYSVYIQYRYVIDGREYTSDRYHFLGGSSSGYEGKAAVVKQHPPGTETRCYVNPKDPTDAVLERGLTSDMWFALIPLVFVAIGAGGVFFSLRSAWRARHPVAGLAPPLSPARATVATIKPRAQVPGRPTVAGQVTLRPASSPRVTFFVSAGVALFWNGIVSVFVVFAVQSWLRRQPEWFLTLFIIPFVLIGLGLIVWVGYSFLALFNPQPVLTVSPVPVPLGGTIEVRWAFSGRCERIARLRLWLEGREEATYRRGTSTCTDKEVFASIEFAQATDPGTVRAGWRKVVVPENLMHSFSASHNKIVWVIKVHGEIERWPDVKEEFPIEVIPAAAPPVTRTT